MVALMPGEALASLRLVTLIFKALKLINQRGMSILLVEQNAAMALRLVHRAYVLESGEITLNGDSFALLRDPGVQKAYLGA